MSTYQKIGMVVAMAKELSPMLASLGQKVGVVDKDCFRAEVYRLGDREIYVCECGIGQISATIATQMLVSFCQVGLVINFGVAGSLNASFDIGDIVLAEGVVHTDRDLSPIDPVKPAQYGEYDSVVIPTTQSLVEVVKSIQDVPVGIVASSEKFVADSTTKDKLVTDYGADLCDMESAGVLLTANRNSIPVIIIKAVSDKADDSAVMDYNNMAKIASKAYVNLITKLLEVL